MKKIRTSKLAVSRETIKALSVTELKEAAGGIDSAPADTCTRHVQAPTPTN